MPRALLLTLWVLLCPSPFPAAGAADSAARYGFDGADAGALALYRRGWIEILENGRWTEAERLYRETVAADPDFIVARSVLARITGDPAERDRLYGEVQARLPDVSEDSRLLLDTYQRTLELFAARQAGEPVTSATRETMARRAISDYGRFLRKYRGEWSVMIEYVEWVHALEGPAAALEEVGRIRDQHDGPVSFSYFPAWFHAELGHHDTARKLARDFARAVADASSPQPHYLNAYLAFSRNNLDAAEQAIERALALDPKHLLAARLRDDIIAARGRGGPGKPEHAAGDDAR